MKLQRHLKKVKAAHAKAAGSWGLWGAGAYQVYHWVVATLGHVHIYWK